MPALLKKKCCCGSVGECPASVLLEYTIQFLAFDPGNVPGTGFQLAGSLVMPMENPLAYQSGQIVESVEFTLPSIGDVVADATFSFVLDRVDDVDPNPCSIDGGFGWRLRFFSSFVQTNGAPGLTYATPGDPSSSNPCNGIGATHFDSDCPPEATYWGDMSYDALSSSFGRRIGTTAASAAITHQ